MFMTREKRSGKTNIIQVEATLSMVSQRSRLAILRRKNKANPLGCYVHVDSSERAPAAGPVSRDRRMEARPAGLGSRRVLLSGVYTGYPVPKCKPYASCNAFVEAPHDNFGAMFH